MAERRVNVGWAEGLHARPASIFVRAATAAGIPVTIAKADGNPVNAASMLAVLGLGAQGGEEIVLASDAEGADAALGAQAREAGRRGTRGASRDRLRTGALKSTGGLVRIIGRALRFSL